MSEQPVAKPVRNRYPGVLWLLPIFFGILGGIIASMFASMKYKAGWVELITVGIIISILESIPAILLMAKAMSNFKF